MNTSIIHLLVLSVSCHSLMVMAEPLYLPKMALTPKNNVLPYDITRQETDKITASTAQEKLAVNTHRNRQTKEGLLILGHHEWIALFSMNVYLSAYIDDQSPTSRIGVEDLVAFERDGDNWVKFVFQKQEYQYPVIKWFKKQTQKPIPVVLLKTKLGERNDVVEYQLIEGGKGIVLGENFMRDIAIQNRQRKYVQPKSQ